MPRECIRHFFPKRKCFVFDRPTKETELLVCVEGIPENQLDQNFQLQSKAFCSHIFSNAKAKTLKEGIIVNGNRELPMPSGISLDFEIVCCKTLVSHMNIEKQLFMLLGKFCLS